MELFRLFGTILIDDKDAISKLKNADKQADKMGKSMHSAFSKITSTAKIAGAAILTGFSAFLVKGAKDASEAEDKVAQLDAVLKSTGGAAGMTKESLIGLADGLEKTTKFSAESALEAESLLLTFTNIGSTVFPRATQAAADMATALGTDMAGQSIALGKALNDPKKGISALTRVGVTFTEEQKNMIASMQDAGDVAGAQTIILAELEKEFGGSAKAAGETFSGKLEILKNKLGNVGEAAATKLMPYLFKFLDFVDQNMPKIEQTVGRVMDGVGKGIDWVKKNADWLIPVLAGVVGGFLAFGIISTVTTLMDTLKLATIAQTFAQGGLNAVMAANPIGVVVLAIGALIAIGVALWKNWDTIKAKLGTLWTNIKEKFESIKTKTEETINKVKAKFDLIVNIITAPFRLGRDKARDAIEAIKTKADSIVERVKTKFKQVVYAITHPFETAKNKAKNIIDAVKDFFKFEWKLPHIKMPHFSVSWTSEGFWGKVGEFLGLPGRPVIGVDWYKEGGIFSKPTIFQTKYGLKGVGDAKSPEVVAPLHKLKKMLGFDGRNVQQIFNFLQSPATPWEIARQTKKATQLLAREVLI